MPGQTRRDNRKKQKGGATPFPQSFFSATLSPHGEWFSSALSSEPTSTMVRPALLAQSGGSRSRKQRKTTRKQMRGGFSPSVMGSFVRNVEALAAPLSIYLAYKMVSGNKSDTRKKRKPTKK